MGPTMGTKQAAVQTEEIVWVKRSVASALAGVTDKTISKWANDGKIKYKREDNGRLLVDRASLDTIGTIEELDDTQSSEEKAFAMLATLLGQAYDHIDRREEHMGKLSEQVLQLHSARDKHTIESIERLNKENAAVHRENEKLRREYAKLEAEAHKELFDTDAHLRSEDRKDGFARAVTDLIASKFGTSEKTKEVIDAIHNMGKAPEVADAT